MPRGLAGIVVIAVCAVFLVGCNGGTVDRHALTNDAATVDSIACEGALLAHDVAQGKTTANYTREQAEALAIQASNFADALAKRPALPSIERRVRAKARDAAKLAATLHRLQDRPSDRDVAATVEQQLSKLGTVREQGPRPRARHPRRDRRLRRYRRSRLQYCGRRDVRLQLTWVIPIGVLGIIVYSEMCGRVAAVSGKAVFDAIRERVGFKAALGALVSSEIVNLMTLACEIGGVAIVLQLLSGLPYRWLILIAVIAFVVIIWVTSFEWIERLFGYGGLCMLVFAVAAVKSGPDWARSARASSRISPRTTRPCTSTSWSACSERR